MANVTVQEITKFIEEHIPEFHSKRLESLAKLKLKKVLRRKNPYLYKAKFVTNAPDLVKAILTGGRNLWRISRRSGGFYLWKCFCWKKIFG